MNKLVTYKDLQEIVSNAKLNYVRQSSQMEISSTYVESVDFRTVAVVDSVLMYLTKNGLLSENVLLDYTDTSDNSEGLD